MTLPFHLNSQIAKISSCRLIPVKTFFLSLVFLTAFLLLAGINNFGRGQVQKYFFSAGFFIVPEFFLYALVYMNSSFIDLSYIRISNLKTQGL